MSFVPAKPKPNQPDSGLGFGSSIGQPVLESICIANPFFVFKHKKWNCSLIGLTQLLGK
jgi:hypothetical protein